MVAKARSQLKSWNLIAIVDDDSDEYAIIQIVMQLCKYCVFSTTVGQQISLAAHSHTSLCSYTGGDRLAGTLTSLRIGILIMRCYSDVQGAAKSTPLRFFGLI